MNLFYFAKLPTDAYNLLYIKTKVIIDIDILIDAKVIRDENVYINLAIIATKLIRSLKVSFRINKM